MRHFSGLIILASLILPGLMGCVVQTDVEAFHIDGAVHRIIVETGRGDIRVVAGSGDAVEVEALLSWEGERPEVRAEYRGGVLHLLSPCVEKKSTCRVAYSLTVPAGVSGSLRSRTGDVFLDGSFEPIEAASLEGAVHRL